jgi:hypothetical protein
MKKRMTLATAFLLMIATTALAIATTALAAEGEKCEDTYARCLSRIGETAGLEVKMEEPVAKVLDAYRVKAALGGKPEKVLKKTCGNVCKVAVKDGHATILLKDATRLNESGAIVFICKDTIATTFGGGQGSTRLTYATHESAVPCALRDGSMSAMQTFNPGGGAR